ncbi:MAG: riboflavin synthase [Spirochaetes bacterium]|jgi:riboflavin synthase|nr:riboflavin synthase [Spirochaetota bacterium]MBP8986517.1 riboflavin synthase [Spirochaetota bacterium]
MFTGIIEEIGTVTSMVQSANGKLISISAHTVLEGTKAGDSICIDGACQTVTQMGNDYFTAFASDVTLSITTLGTLKQGAKVNLERAMQPQGRFGGHFVQGHVDGTGTIVAVKKLPDGLSLMVDVPQSVSMFIVPKGSIAVDGISLTVVHKGKTIELYCIPETMANTTLSTKKRGDRINLEVDIIAKYVYSMVQSMKDGDSSLATKLKDEGFWL